MNLQVLVATMHQTDHSLLEKMNIRSSAIVINQCEYDNIERFTFRGNDILWMNLRERGVGLSRNTALMRATGDILLFADDDVIYSDDYEQKIIRCFEKNKKADLITFNLQSQNKNRPEAIVDKEYWLHWYNSLKFGACRIAIKKDAVQKANVFFSLLFGGVTAYQSGEDTLFIIQCLQKGIVGLASNITIGIVKQEESTWFKGYNKIYFFDKGVLMKQCFGCWAKPLIIALLIKNRVQTRELGLKVAVAQAFKGADSI